MPKYSGTLGADIRAYHRFEFEAKDDATALKDAQTLFIDLRDSNGYNGDDLSYDYPKDPAIVSLVNEDENKTVADGIDFIAEPQQQLADSAQLLRDVLRKAQIFVADEVKNRSKAKMDYATYTLVAEIDAALKAAGTWPAENTKFVMKYEELENGGGDEQG